MSGAIIKNFVKVLSSEKLFLFAPFIMKSKKNNFYYIDGKEINCLNDFIQKINSESIIYDNHPLDNFTKSMYHIFSNSKNATQTIIITSNFNTLINNINIPKQEFINAIKVVFKMFEHENNNANNISLDFYFCEDSVDFIKFDKLIKNIIKKN